MPIYDFMCAGCAAESERAMKVDEPRVGLRCEVCGGELKRILTVGHGGIKGDSIADVSWLPSALKTLPDDAARRIESRTDWKRYLKQEGLVCKG